MEFAALLLIPLVLAVVVKLATAWRARRDTRKPTRAERARALYVPPTFSVVALGAKGSGKTVFLSSMFHKLNFQAPGRSYYLETDPQQRIALARTYSNVSDTAKPWPPGTRTGETREFVFDCVGVDERNAKHTVLRMSCLDYPGEALEAEQEAGSTVLDDLVERIHGAHALLGMIDGHRVLQLLRDEPAGRDYFERSLQPMLGFMQGASCPIHLVLTKWDLLRDNAPASSGDDEALLDAVIAAMMRFEQIKSLVYVHSRNQIVRLIPVSAVGSTFAHLDPEGKVVKRSDGELRPTNVEVPLCAVLPDLFKQVEMSLDQSVRSGVNADMFRQMRKDAGAMVAYVLGRPAGTALRLFLQGTLGRDVGSEATTLFLDWLARPADGDQRLSHTRTKLEEEAARLQQLHRTVIEDFRRAVLRLEAVLPNSELSRAW